jgi:hypothetical protein
VEIEGRYYMCVEPLRVWSGGADEAVKRIRKSLTEKRD